MPQLSRKKHHIDITEIFISFSCFMMKWRHSRLQPRSSWHQGQHQLQHLSSMLDAQITFQLNLWSAALTCNIITCIVYCMYLKTSAQHRWCLVHWAGHRSHGHSHSSSHCSSQAGARGRRRKHEGRRGKQQKQPKVVQQLQPLYGLCRWCLSMVLWNSLLWKGWLLFARFVFW